MKVLIAVGIVTLALVATGSVAAADSRRPTCTIGEAMSNFEAPVTHFESDEIAERFVCQYRLFFGGRTFTYCEDDVILAGIVINSEYVNRGISRDAGIADIKARQPIGAWLDGVAQPLMQTAYKDAIHPTRGHLVYQQVGYVTTLSPGTHLSVLQTRMGTFTVTLNVLPRTDAAC